MLCADFEDRLTDYIEGTLSPAEARPFAEHAMRCPVCHDLLSEVKNTINACQLSEPAPPPAELEARILMQTMPETAMTCEEFEDCLTDYLDGFLPAPLYHRWERHAALCANCTELPGQVVRSIGACYTYINEERAVPAGLHERILQATLGTTQAEEVRAPLAARIAAWMRVWLDPIVSPQLATVATMLLVAVLVLTSTVSADGSIGGIYRAGVRMAEKTYEANTAVKGVADGITDFMSRQQPAAPSNKKEAAKPEQSREQKNR
ncbi:MAG TPA: anti-sigma factor [Pyrinomonadaceae bacterium]|jgi:anti-sigma factor RsiW|nr:anti-sigma factor [Pyrinomonadaceae bacterium]